MCTVISTRRCAVLRVLWIGFCLTGPISLYIDSFVFVFLSYCIVHMCYMIVTQYGGPDGIEV